MLEREKQKFSEQRESGKGDIEMSLEKYLLILYHREEEPYCLKKDTEFYYYNYIPSLLSITQFHDTYHDNFVQNR